MIPTPAMSTIKKILIVKLGALGDVVRTSYFAKPLKKKYPNIVIDWLTSDSAKDLIRFNPCIDNIHIYGVANLFPVYDTVYSLEDDIEVAKFVTSRFGGANIVGAYSIGDSEVSYTDDAREWFDMGLISKYGKAHADNLKIVNTQSHAEIFSNIFGVEDVCPRFYGNKVYDVEARTRNCLYDFTIGFVPYAGSRWPSKELTPEVNRELLELVHAHLKDNFQNFAIQLFVDSNRVSDAINLSQGIRNVVVVDTGSSVLKYSAAIKAVDALICPDTLGMHLGVAQDVATVAYFAPTSASEIGSYPWLTTVTSLADDYCTYRKHVDRSTLTAKRIFDALLTQLKNI